MLFSRLTHFYHENLCCVFKVRCIVCPKIFCCSDCRWNHEKFAHGLEYDCPLCRGFKFLCQTHLLENISFTEHIVSEHLPLHCNKCNKIFRRMEDFFNVNKCTSMSELVNKSYEKPDKQEKTLEDKFDSIYEKVANEQNNDNENYEAILSVNKSNRTAVITPIQRQIHIVDYELTDSELEDSPKSKIQRTPHPRVPKTPQIKRVATPHVKKFLIRQRATGDNVYFENYFVNENSEIAPDQDQLVNDEKTTPSRDKDDASEYLSCNSKLLL